MKTLLLIDPQNDFMNLKDSTLPVFDAVSDMERVIKKMESVNFDNIVVTLDTHDKFNIAFSEFWVDESGKNPAPFTIITLENVVDKKWIPAKKELYEYCIFYLSKLKEAGKCDLIIWPYHCIKNTWGWNIYEPLKNALNKWELSNNKLTIKIIKGESSLTEHYSAVKAEVPLAEDIKTLPNKEMLDKISSSDEVFIAGEAFSHCVYSTVKDLIEYFSDNEKKSPAFIIYENATSPVSGFEKQADKIKSDLISLGVSFRSI